MTGLRKARGGQGSDATHSQFAAPRLSVTLPWPPKILSPNARTRSHRWKVKATRDYRNACALAAWDCGVRPEQGLRLERIVFHPPDRRHRDKVNTFASFKAGQDGLADAMGVDDHEFNDAPNEIGSVIKGGAVVVLLTDTGTG